MMLKATSAQAHKANGNISNDMSFSWPSLIKRRTHESRIAAANSVLMLVNTREQNNISPILTRSW